ncbi:MAG: glycosyltransferase [Akkermansiaceae bacterium]|nr:glycosyltransferase [Akkermansiaceae bacterium]
MHKPVVASYCATFLKPEMLHIYRQVTGLRRFDTFVICKERKHSDRFPFPDVRVHRKARSNFIRRFWMKYVRKEPPIVYRGEYGALRHILEQRSDVDLMHVYFGHTGVHLLPFILRWPKPTIVSFHGMDVQPRENQPGYLDDLRSLLKTAPLVMVRSESLKQRLVEIGCRPDKIRMNRTSIPTVDFPFQPRREPGNASAWHLVQACRLIEKKGLDVTLRVFAAFLRDCPEAMLTIAGDGPLENSLRDLARQLGVADRVRFAGFLSGEELRDLFYSAHVFIHPSRITADQNQEGVPNSMLEAMATGLPVLATRHGGIPEAVEEGRTGLLCDEDDEEALLKNLRRMINRLEEWREMGRQAAASVRENYDQERGIENLEAIYLEALRIWQTGRAD